MWISWIIIQIHFLFSRIRFNYKQVTITWLNVYIYDNDWIMQLKKRKIDIDPLSDFLKIMIRCLSSNNTFPWQENKTVLPPMGALFHRLMNLIWIVDFIERLEEKVPIGFWFTDAISQLFFTILMACNFFLCRIIN